MCCKFPAKPSKQVSNDETRKSFFKLLFINLPGVREGEVKWELTVRVSEREREREPNVINGHRRYLGGEMTCVPIEILQCTTLGERDVRDVSGGASEESA